MISSWNFIMLLKRTGAFTHRLLSPTLEEFTALVNKLVGQVTIEQALVNNAPLKHVIFVPDVVRETQSEWAACESALNAIPGVQVRMVSCARRAALDMNLLYTSLKKSACKIFFSMGLSPIRPLNQCKAKPQRVLPTAPLTMNRPLSRCRSRTDHQRILL